jgi:hypothetical protein
LVASYGAYFRGDAPLPEKDLPCPAGVDPDWWAEVSRQTRCLWMRARGDLAPDRYLSGMTERDRDRADSWWHAFHAIDWSQCESPCIEPED